MTKLKLAIGATLLAFSFSAAVASNLDPDHDYIMVGTTCTQIEETTCQLGGDGCTESGEQVFDDPACKNELRP